MQALRFEQTGSLDNLTLADMPKPKPGAGEMLIEVHAAGLNPSDAKNVCGRFPYTTVPRTPGRDFAGVVVEGPSGLIGRKVWGTGKEVGFTRDGSHAAFLALPADGAAPMPTTLSFGQAAACGVPYTTAWDALERCGVRSGVSMLVVGAGAVGTAALALGKWLGAEMFAAVRRPAQAEALRTSGVRVAILEEGKSLGDATKEILPKGADVVFDTTGQWVPQTVPVLSTFGRIAIIAAPADGHANVPILALYRKGGSLIGVNSLLHDSRACAKMMATIGEGFEGGHLPKPDLREWVFADGIAAYREVDKGAREKIVLTKMAG
jgi:NADPH:quinone reductase-like Zn-dependent oxidoreductase